MIVTLTKLLEIKIVANNRSELLRKLLIIASDGCSSFSTSFKSIGDKEKKAISDADTKPEQYNKSIAKTNATIAPKVGVNRVTLSKSEFIPDKYESGSKEYKFS